MINETLSYHFSTTLDGSPTLALACPEKMHNGAGALSETAYVYGKGLDFVIQNSLSPRFLVVGLGLAYIEMMIATQFLTKPVFILSFEKEKVLKTNFLSWLQDQDPEANDFYEVYDQILQKTAQKFKVDKKILKARLLFLYGEGFWKIEGELTAKTIFSGESFSTLFFDAFSHKTSPELWGQNFLEQFIKKFAADRSAFASYACTSNLRRALESQGFHFHKSSGFHNKRNSTWATRL